MSRLDIAAEGSALEQGQSARMVCPFCGGGAAKERSMSIKRDEETGLILYHCFRANCGEAGVLGGSRSLVRTRQPVSTFQPWQDDHLLPISPNQNVPDGVYLTLDGWGLSAKNLSWFYDPYDDRICMPILGPLNDMRGYVRRAYRKGSYPKALVGRTEDKPLVSFHYADVGGTAAYSVGRVVCVEDIPSATRLALAGMNAIALLGCTPSDEVLDLIGNTARKVLWTDIVFALDADASRQAIRLVRQYSMRGAARAQFLTKDVKNMTEEELTQWLNGL